jgi:hypothetical protein
MCSIVSGEGVPEKNQMVTASLPTAIQSPKSAYGSSNRQRRNHSALRRGLRTASPKCPTFPSVNGFMSRLYPGSRRPKAG